LFQLYDRGLMEPRVVDKRLCWGHGENVADFGLYSAAVMSELLCFLDDLGVALADCLGIKLGVGPGALLRRRLHILVGFDAATTLIAPLGN